MDLLYHFIAGIVIALVVILLARNTKDKTLAVAALLPLAAGVFKEVVIDYWLKSSSMDGADVTLTWTGGIALITFIKFIELFRKD